MWPCVDWLLCFLFAVVCVADVIDLIKWCAAHCIFFGADNNSDNDSDSDSDRRAKKPCVFLQLVNARLDAVFQDPDLAWPDLTWRSPFAEWCLFVWPRCYYYSLLLTISGKWFVLAVVHKLLVAWCFDVQCIAWGLGDLQLSTAARRVNN